ncbi:MAG: TonB-dependent receptor [Halieaceae bacterium]|jgi:iron complex outermembrane receptor protein|nr:TonB-dependent receptor [Halieaceae bacterium]
MNVSQLLPPAGLFKLTPISVLVLGASMATAQTEHADTADRSEEVIVLSSPLRTGTDEIVLGTTVLDRSALLREMNGTIGETLANQPGVSSTFFGPGASRPIIRGLGGDRIRILSNDISSFDVSTASNDHLVAVEMANAQQVEILRGAATLRYGQNAIGGIVNVYDDRIPRELPEDGFDADVTAGLSSVDEGYTVGGSTNIQLGSNLVLHLDGNSRDADEYEIDGFASEEAEEEGERGSVENTQTEATSGTVGLSWIGEKGYIGFSVARQEGVYGIPGSKKKKKEEEDEDELVSILDEDDEEEEEGGVTIDFEQTRYDLDAEYNFASGLVKLAKFRVGYAEYEHTEFAGDEPETEFSDDEWEARAEAFLNDFDMGDGTVTGSFGLTAGDRDFEVDGDEAFVPRNEQFRWGAFGLLHYHLGGFIGEASLRFDSQENKTSDLSFAGGDFDETQETFSAALTGIYELSEGTSVGINLARSERAPTAEELFSNGFHPATNTVEIGDVNLDTEVAYSAELSFKRNMGAFSFGANVYYVDYSDFIFLSPTGDFFEEGDPFPADEGIPVFAYQQADAEFYGFEAEADYLALDSENWTVSFDGQLDLVRAETTQDTTFGGIDNVRDEFTPLGTGATTVAAGDLPFIPPMRFLGGVNAYYKPLSASMRLELQYVDDQDRVGEAPEGSEVDIAGTVPTDSYTFVNAYFTVDPTDYITLSLRVRNMTDEFARSATSFLSQAAPLPGRNIMFGVNVRY